LATLFRAGILCNENKNSIHNELLKIVMLPKTQFSAFRVMIE